MIEKSCFARRIKARLSTTSMSIPNVDRNKEVEVTVAAVSNEAEAGAKVLMQLHPREAPIKVGNPPMLVAIIRQRPTISRLGAPTKKGMALSLNKYGAHSMDEIWLICPRTVS